MHSGVELSPLEVTTRQPVGTGPWHLLLSPVPMTLFLKQDVQKLSFPFCLQERQDLVSQGSLADASMAESLDSKWELEAISMLLASSYPMSSMLTSKFTDPVSLMLAAVAIRASRRIEIVNLIVLEFMFIKIEDLGIYTKIFLLGWRP